MLTDLLTMALLTSSLALLPRFPSGSLAVGANRYDSRLHDREHKAVGWKEWFGLKLPPQQFAQMVIERTKKFEMGEYTYSPNTNEIVKGQGTGAGSIFLGRMYDQYSQAPRRQRMAVVDRFLSSMASTPENKIPAAYADARLRVLPIVRDQIDLSIARLMSSRFTQDTQAPSMTALPLVDRLIAGLAFDTPNAIHRLTDKHLEDWSVDAKTALDDAIDNLRTQTRAGGWSQLEDNGWSGDWGDAYASSRMLTPEVIHQLGLADPLVMVPCPEFILVADGNRPDAFEALGAIAEHAAKKGKRQLSMTVYRLKQQRWEIAPLPEGQGKLLRTLQAQATYIAYADQKQLLDDLHSRKNVDVFVASHQLVEDSNGTMQSIGIWTDGVPTMLPHSDLVLLQELDEIHRGVIRRVIVPFTEVQRHIPRQLQVVEGLDPSRYQTRGFPGKDIWQKLEAVAVTLPPKQQ
ncbi:MAG: hypothetical protein EOP36_01745 [Rubrivivax sp.]|nr:MAG: hypothetical protein EOP36_01745 [Rubrivivax sp.]